MTTINNYAIPPTPTPRFSASARPIPRESTYRLYRRRMRGIRHLRDVRHVRHVLGARPVRSEPTWATIADRAKITAAVATLLALVAFVVAAPSTLTIPILVVLTTALIVGGLFRMIARLTRPILPPDDSTRRDA